MLLLERADGQVKRLPTGKLRACQHTNIELGVSVLLMIETKNKANQVC